MSRLPPVVIYELISRDEEVDSHSRHADAGWFETSSSDLSYRLLDFFLTHAIGRLVLSVALNLCGLGLLIGLGLIYAVADSALLIERYWLLLPGFGGAAILCSRLASYARPDWLRQGLIVVTLGLMLLTFRVDWSGSKSLWRDQARLLPGMSVAEADNVMARHWRLPGAAAVDDDQIVLTYAPVSHPLGISARCQVTFAAGRLLGSECGR